MRGSLSLFCLQVFNTMGVPERLLVDFQEGVCSSAFERIWIVENCTNNPNNFLSKCLFYKTLEAVRGSFKNYLSVILTMAYSEHYVTYFCLCKSIVYFEYRENPGQDKILIVEWTSTLTASSSCHDTNISTGFPYQMLKSLGMHF